MDTFEEWDPIQEAADHLKERSKSADWEDCGVCLSDGFLTEFIEYPSSETGEQRAEYRERKCDYCDGLGRVPARFEAPLICDDPTAAEDDWYRSRADDAAKWGDSTSIHEPSRSDE